MALVTVIYHHEDGVWWAESDEMPGLSAASGQFGVTRQFVRDAVPEYYGTDTVDLIERLDSGAAIIDAQFAAVIQGLAGVIVAPSVATTYTTSLNRSVDRVNVVNVRLTSVVPAAQ